MDFKINIHIYFCSSNITSFSQCVFPKGVTRVHCENNLLKSFQYLPSTVSHIFCRNNHIKSFKYLPESVTRIYCQNNQIKSFKYLPESVRYINCQNNQIKSFQYLPGSVHFIDCENNQINSFQYLPTNVLWISCENNTCNVEYMINTLLKIHQKNKDRIISDFKTGVDKLRYMRLNYLINSIWKRYWYEQRDIQGYSRACRHLASKNCPNGFLSMKYD